MSDPMVLTIVTPYSMNGFVFLSSIKKFDKQSFILKLRFIKNLQHFFHYCDISVKFAKPGDCNLL